MSKNLDVLWNHVKTPDPEHVKSFKRAGGFSGSATNTQYIVQMATEVFGVHGVGWGTIITDEQYVNGHKIYDKEGRDIGNNIIHVLRGKVWFILDGEKYETGEQFGQTTFVGTNKYGAVIDEEAPKKSATDMMLKCLSLLGFSADIFLGKWDDNKYVNDVRKKLEQDNNKTPDHPTESKSKQKRYKAESWLNDQAKEGLDTFTSKWNEYKDYTLSGLDETDKKYIERLHKQLEKQLMEDEGIK